MPKVRDIFSYVDSYLESSSFEDACPNGLQVEASTEVKSFAFAVSASEEVIAKAAEKKVDLLLVHHGLFWSSESPALVASKARKASALFKAGISLLAYHLPLDAHRVVGNNWKAAKDLGWEGLEPFGNNKAKKIGVKGHFPPQSQETFMRSLESYYGHRAHHAPSSSSGEEKNIASAALISGAAHMSIREAVEEGLDAFITGSFDEPVWHIACEEKIDFFALGHSASEEVGVKALGEKISEIFSIPGFFIHSPNPF